MAKEFLAVLLISCVQYVLGFPMSSFPYGNSSNLIEMMKRGAFTQPSDGYSSIFDFFNLEQTLQNTISSPLYLEQILKSKPNLQQYGTSNIEPMSFPAFGQTEIYNNYLKEFAMKCLQHNPFLTGNVILCLPAETVPVISDNKEEQKDPVVEEDPEFEIQENDGGGEPVTDADDTGIGKEEDKGEGTNTGKDAEQNEDTQTVTDESPPVVETNQAAEEKDEPTTDTKKDDEEEKVLPADVNEGEGDPNVDDATAKETSEGDSKEDPKTDDLQVENSENAVPDSGTTGDKGEESLQDDGKATEGVPNDDSNKETNTNEGSKKVDGEETSTNGENKEGSEDKIQDSKNESVGEINSNGNNEESDPNTSDKTEVQDPNASIDKKDEEEKALETDSKNGEISSADKDDTKEKDDPDSDNIKEGEMTVTETKENAPTDEKNQEEKDEAGSEKVTESEKVEEKNTDDNKGGEVIEDDPSGDDKEDGTETNTEAPEKEITTGRPENVMERMIQEMCCKCGNGSIKCGDDVNLILCNIMQNLCFIADKLSDN